MEIKSNPKYNSLVNYLNNGGEKPNANDVYEGLMELAKDVKVENTIIHKDVIDAMIRQPFTNATKPFKTNLIENKTIINAVDYDLGKNGKAYFDLDTADYHVATNKRGAGNKGRMYRNDGVDIAKDSLTSDKFFVNSIEKGEWLQYTIHIAKKGNYTLKLNIASDHNDGSISVTVNGQVVVSSFAVPNTGGLKKFNIFEVKNFPLEAGMQVVRFTTNNGGYNFSYFQLIKSK